MNQFSVFGMIKPKLGIEISRPERPGRIVIHREPYSLRYDFNVAKSKKSALDFVTTKDVQRVIVENKSKEGEKVGWMEFHVYPDERLIEYCSYFPFDHARKNYWEPSYFGRIGLASLIELQVLRDLNERLPGYGIAHDDLVYNPRKRQYFNRGLWFPGRKISLTRAIALCRRQVVRNYFKNHPEKQVKGRLKLQLKKKWNNLKGKLRRKKK